MKITIYELLGLIKDGKAPKKIKLDSFIFELINNMYINNEMGLLDEYISITNQLNTKIEIIEEDKKIEKLSIRKSENGTECLLDERGVYCGMNKHSRVIAHKINELIDELNKLKVSK